MPNWNEVFGQIQQLQAQFSNHAANAINVVKGQYLGLLHQKTGRNVIAYYSGFLSKPQTYGTEISDEDKNGFMMAVHKLDRSKAVWDVAARQC